MENVENMKNLLLIVGTLLIVGCSGSSDGNQNNGNTSGGTTPSTATDISNLIFTATSGDCADYADTYAASVMDVTRSLGFSSDIEIMAGVDSCMLVSDNIPNHDFNDASARFANQVAEVNRTFSIPRNPVLAANPTPIEQPSWDAVMLNGVVLDLLSAGCYRPDDPQADANGNVPIGCNANSAWLMDPLGTNGGFGVDQHNAHTQPDGSYHYHGDPQAMFDDNPGPNGSPVIGFAADGFPIYGSYFMDMGTGSVRAAVSGYQLKAGNRPFSAADPGGPYDGMYVDDYEFAGTGDLDECNGMTVDSQYGYYVTDSYPWVLKCHSGTVDPSFSKN